MWTLMGRRWRESWMHLQEQEKHLIRHGTYLSQESGDFTQHSWVSRQGSQLLGCATSRCLPYRGSQGQPSCIFYTSRRETQLHVLHLWGRRKRESSSRSSSAAHWVQQRPGLSETHRKTKQNRKEEAAVNQPWQCGRYSRNNHTGLLLLAALTHSETCSKVLDFTSCPIWAIIFLKNERASFLRLCNTGWLIP